MARDASLRGSPLWHRRSLSTAMHKALVYLFLISLSIVFAFPFFWIVTTALKPAHQVFLWPPQWIPDPPQPRNFVEALGNPQLPFGSFFGNSLLLAAGVIGGRLVSCTLAAYGFARLNAPGKNVLFGILLSTLMLPRAVTMIPRFILFSRLGWVNTFAPLIVPAWFGEAYAIFLMRQFFLSIPRDIEDAAMIDGANTLEVIGHVIVPLSLPVLAVITILSFKDVWNDFFGPLLYLNERSKYTVAVGLAYYNGQFNVKMNLLMAASAVAMLPVLLLFFVAQNAFVEGISLTGLSGR
jgi:ABC-type glycerol-3-phosphate transport system permease component